MGSLDKAKTRIKERLYHWYGLASADHRAKGRIWYINAYEFALELSGRYNVALEQAVGVIAALSPSVYWEANKRQAEALCRAHCDGEDLMNIVVTTYGRQAQKARDILSILSVGFDSDDIRAMLGKRAFKTQAFFDNIFDPWYGGHEEGPHPSVTIDQHIVEAAGFTEFWTCSAAWCYLLIKDIIREMALEQNMLPCQMQAIIWIVYKDLTDSRHPGERAADRRIEELPV